ncbi:unnamed protein product, partial [Mycena citricolor]
FYPLAYARSPASNIRFGSWRFSDPPSIDLWPGSRATSVSSIATLSVAQSRFLSASFKSMLFYVNFLHYVNLVFLLCSIHTRRHWTLRMS